MDNMSIRTVFTDEEIRFMDWSQADYYVIIGGTHTNRGHRMTLAGLLAYMLRNKVSPYERIGAHFEDDEFELRWVPDKILRAWIYGPREVE